MTLDKFLADAEVEAEAERHRRWREHMVYLMGEALCMETASERLEQLLGENLAPPAQWRVFRRGDEDSWNRQDEQIEGAVTVVADFEFKVFNAMSYISIRRADTKDRWYPLVASRINPVKQMGKFLVDFPKGRRQQTHGTKSEA